MALETRTQLLRLDSGADPPPPFAAFSVQATPLSPSERLPR